MAPSYAQKRHQWCVCLRGPDQNSIGRQLVDLIEDMGTFGVILRARPEREPDGFIPGVNYRVHSFLDRCFVAKVATDIRRLVDAGSLDGDRGVYSLMALLKDMKSHGTLFRREDIIAAEAGPVNTARSARSAHALEERHAEIDYLAGTTQHGRKKTDCIAASHYDGLMDQLGQLTRDFKIKTDKFVAHAATLSSRALVHADAIAFTFESIVAACIGLCRVADFIGVYFLGLTSQNFFAPIGDQELEHLDAPLASTAQLALLKTFLDDLRRDWQRQSTWTLSQSRTVSP